MSNWVLGKVSLRPAQRRTSDKTAVEIALTGRVRDSLFSNRQFGADKEILEDLQFGTIDMGGITNVVVANFEPTYQLIDLPFLFGHSAQTHDVSDGPVGQKIAENPRSSGAVSLGSFRNIIKIFAPFLHRKT